MHSVGLFVVRLADVGRVAMVAVGPMAAVAVKALAPKQLNKCLKISGESARTSDTNSWAS